MVLIQLIAIVIFGGIWSAVLAPLLQFAFKLVEGQRNEFRDAYRICFSATFIHLVVQSVLPFFLANPGSLTHLELSLESAYLPISLHGNLAI